MTSENFDAAAEAGELEFLQAGFCPDCEERIDACTGLCGCDDDDGWPEDDGQPTEYDEWQDVYGGDDWDHGQYDDYFDDAY